MSSSQVSGRCDERAGREFFQPERMILKGRVQIGLRQVAGVAGFGKQAEIGQLQLRDQRAFLFGRGVALIAQPGGIGESGRKYASRAECGDECEMAGAGGGHGLNGEQLCARLCRKF